MSTREPLVEVTADIATRILYEALYHDGYLCILLSNNSDAPLLPPNDCPFGSYVLTFSALERDPLFPCDSVSGTIFAVYKRISAEGNRGTEEDLLRKGSEQVAAGYILYGNNTVLVYTVGQGVHSFSMHPSVKEFFAHSLSLRVPHANRSLFINFDEEQSWDADTRRAFHSLTDHDFEIQYSSNILADFHHQLGAGGVAAFPKSTQCPDGPLDYLTQAAPLAFIIEQAGGVATDGQSRLLEKKAKSLHDKTALFMGCPVSMSLLSNALKAQQVWLL